MVYRIRKKDSTLNGIIHLPSSKSESNRALIIRALYGKHFEIKNLSEAEDTKILETILTTNLPDRQAGYQLPTTNSLYNAGPAGTAMRFLTSFFSVQEGKAVCLTGTKRMKERPIKILVDALMELGADIEYIEKPGFPPLKITGKKLKGGKIIVDGSISSQYISSLLMIAPVLKNGLEVEFEGEVISKPYVDMTLKIMEHFGIKYKAGKNSVTVNSQEYQPNDFTVESDWSAASYWYEMAAFAGEVDLTLAGLKKESLQGDSIIAKLFVQFGIETTYLKNGVHLKKIQPPQPPDVHRGNVQCAKKSNELETYVPLRGLTAFNFSNCPDLAQTFAVTCAGLGIAANLSGLKTLRIKETDRVKALQNELIKTGIRTENSGDNELKIFKSALSVPQSPVATYEDHRMAMAFAPLAMKSGDIRIENPEVVKKSYPGFWKDLVSVGFEIRNE